MTWTEPAAMDDWVHYLQMLGLDRRRNVDKTGISQQN
jgi:hypothetical protein